MEKPLVSVIMSVYDTEEEYLNESISSILNQTYTNLEFIIIDDASTNDNVDKVVNNINDSRIKLVRNERNIGLTKNLNRGIDYAEGEYIARMDADDISEKKRIEKQIQFLEYNNNVDVLGTSAKRFGDDSGIIRVPNSHNLIQANLLLNSPMIHPSIMFRRRALALEKYNNNVRKAQDYDLWSRLIWETKFANLNEPLIKYRIHNKQITSSSSNDRINVVRKIRNRLLLMLDNNITKEYLFLMNESGFRNYLDEKQIIELANYSSYLLTCNEKVKLYNQESLTKILSKNLDEAIFINARKHKKFPLKNVKIKPKHHFNLYSMKKYIALLYKN